MNNILYWLDVEMIIEGYIGLCKKWKLISLISHYFLKIWLLEKNLIPYVACIILLSDTADTDVSTGNRKM